MICLLFLATLAQAKQVIRTFSPPTTPGEPFEVTLSVQGDGHTGIGIIEQLPPGFEFANLESLKQLPGKTDLSNNRLALTLFDSTPVTYWIVSKTTSTPSFSGIYIDLLKRDKEKDSPEKRFNAINSKRLHTNLLPKTKGSKPLASTDVIPGDTNKDNVLSQKECTNLIVDYLLGKNSANLDDISDAAWVFSRWQGKPKTVKDMAGRQTTFYRPVERIITTNPDNSMIIISFGLGKMIVGTDECTIGGCICPRKGNRKGDPKASPQCWSGVCEGELEQIPQTSTRKTVNHEFIASLSPDVIFETTFWATRSNDMEAKVGSKVIVAGADFTVDSWYRQIRLIGQVLDKEKEAETLIALCKEKVGMITAVTATIPKHEKPRVYFAPRGARKGFHDPKEGRDFTRTYQTYAPLELAGGLNVANEVSGSNVNVSIEQIIAWNPDHIFVACSSAEDKGVEFLKEAPELSSIVAIMKSQIYNVMYPHCRGRPIPRNIINVMLMAKLLYPEQFKSLDLEKEGNEIYRAFLGVDNAFTEYAEYLEFPLEFFEK